jgi:hypothetical protein
MTNAASTCMHSIGDDRGARVWRLGLPQWLSGSSVEGGMLRWGHQSITVGHV